MIKFDSEPVDNEKYLRTKIKSYKEKITPIFYNNKTLKEGPQCNCLSVKLIDSVYIKDKNYYPRVFFRRM